MRKLFLAIAAVATLLASCSKDDAITGVSKSQVTFTVSAPEMETRAGDYGNGTQATELYYAVYDAVEGTSYVKGLSKVEANDHLQLDEEGKATVTINLVEGRTYDIIFYAEHNFAGDDPEAVSPYSIDWANRTLSVASNLTANQETYDAFYAHVDGLKVGTAAINETVYLRRPFAQLNILTTDQDFTDGAAAGINISTTAVTVKNIYTKMNLFTDQVDPQSEAAVTFGAADVLTDVVTENNTKYHWLSMNYLLVNDKKMVDVEFTMTDSTVADSSKDNKLVRNYATVPVERNHRTNIYGSIITNPAVFNVEIDEEFLTPDHNVNGDNHPVVTVATADDLQAAIDAAKVGERTIIKFEGDIAGTNTAAEIWVAQKNGVQIVIDGCGYEFNGTFKVHNNSATSCDGTLDFVNIDFKTSISELNFIHTKDFGKDSAGNTRRYSQNITVSDCTFEAVNNATEVVGVQVKASKNLHIINCTAKNMHSLMQAKSCDDKILVENVTIENCSEGGVAFGNAAYPTIKNSTINADLYGIRADGEAGRGNLVVENVNITAKAPIAIRNVVVNDKAPEFTYSATLKGNTLTSTGLYDVIFTAANINNEASLNSLTAPTGNWSITGAEGLNVYPTAAESGEFNASSNTQLSQAIAAGATTVNLAEGTYSMPSTGGKSVTITGTEGAVIKANTSNLGGGDLTLKGVTIEAGSYNGFQHSGVVTYNDVTVNGQLNLYGTKDIFNDCTFNLNNTYVWTYGSDYTEFNNCTFNTTGKAILIYNEGAGACDVKVKDCTFNATAGATASAIANQNCAAIEIDNYAKMSHKLTTSNNNYSNNFSGEWRIKSYVEGAPVTVNGVEYTSIAIDGKEMTIDTNKNVTVVE